MSRASLTFLLGVVTGTGAAIITKVVYGIESTGVDGKPSHFEKPFFLTSLMFVAMTFAMPLYWFREWYATPAMASVNDGTILLSGRTRSKATSWRTLFMFLVPAGFDLAATALAAIGLLYTTVSMYQLVRCSVMIVTAVLKATVLRQSLKTYMWIGIGINTVAMILISAISFIPGHMESQPGVYGDPRLGIMFILLSCLVQGSQYVFEEKLMLEDKAHPLLVVGMEGVWGLLIMALIVVPWAALLPGHDAGACMENTYDSFVMIQNSRTIQLLLFTYFVCVFLFNIFAIYVTYLLNSVWHAILENFRPVAIWMVDLSLFYFITNEAFGEAWTKWSWIQLIGMIILMFGTAIYNGSIELPFCDYSDDDLIEENETTAKHLPHWGSESATPMSASPLIQKGVPVDRPRRPSNFGFASHPLETYHHGIDSESIDIGDGEREEERYIQHQPIASHSNHSSPLLKRENAPQRTYGANFSPVLKSSHPSSLPPPMANHALAAVEGVLKSKKGSNKPSMNGNGLNGKAKQSNGSRRNSGEFQPASNNI